MLSLLKHLVAGKELNELSRWRSNWEHYRRWLAEFPIITVTLDNMKNEVVGTEWMDACHPPFPRGPWTVDNLRYHLRNLVLNISTLRKVDDVWSFEPERRTTETSTLRAQIASLEAQLEEASSFAVNKNREVNQLRFICTEAHHAMLHYETLDMKKGLENLDAASRGLPIPHTTFINR